MAEQVGPVAKCCHVRQAVATVGQHHGQVDEHPARVMAPAALTDRCHRHRQRIGKPGGAGHLGHEQPPGVAGHGRAISGHPETRSALATASYLKCLPVT